MLEQALRVSALPTGRVRKSQGALDPLAQLRTMGAAEGDLHVPEDVQR